MYISRVENGHTVPSIETLEKFACALDLSLWQLFYGLDIQPRTINSPDETDGSHRPPSRREERQLQKFIAALARMNDAQRDRFMAIAAIIAKGPTRQGNSTRRPLQHSSLG
jgi:transcriptional regulator with XRE-family HTH domain